MAVLDVLRRARDLVAAGADIIDALRQATPSTRDRLEAYRAYLRARLGPEEPAALALEAAIADLTGPDAPDYTCAYCGCDLSGDYYVDGNRRVTAWLEVVPGATRGLAVCHDCAPHAALDSAAIAALLSATH